MTLTEARRQIAEATLRDECTMFLFVTPRPCATGGYEVDPEGFGISDWYDQACVETWHKGKQRD